MAMARPDKRGFDLKIHATAKTTASNHPGHATFFARSRSDVNCDVEALAEFQSQNAGIVFLTP
jgi:hypothetical protein